MSKKKTNKKKGMDYEQKVQKTLSSGSLWFNKGDLQTDNYVIECKFTEQKGFRISTKILKKLWEEALDANKLPLLMIGIKDEDCKWMMKVEINREV